MTIRRLLAAASLALLGWQTPAFSADLLVGAASSLGPAFTELATRFQQKNPGTKVLMSFASSDALAQQIAQGAPIDVFAAADPLAMDHAINAGSVEPSSMQDFASNEIVLIVPASSQLNITSVADLASEKVKRIAIGNPATVPAGRYAKAALQESGHWEVLQPREVMAQNVRQALDYVVRDEVDAGFVFASDAALFPEKVKIVTRVPTPGNVRYVISLVQREGRNPQAPAFIEYVMSPDAQAVLSRYGFSPAR